MIETLREAAGALERVRAVGDDDLPPLRARLDEIVSGLSDLARGWEAADARRDQGLSELAELTIKLNDAHAAANERVAAFEAQVKAARGSAEIAELNLIVAQEEADVLREKLAVESRAKQEVEAQYKKASAEAEEAKREAVEAGAKAKASAVQLSEALEALTDLGFARVALEGDLSRARGQIDKLEAEREALREELGAAKAALEASVGELEAEKERAEVAAKDFTSELEGRCAELETLRASLVSAEQQRDEGALALEESRGRLAELEAERARIAELEAERERLANAVAAAEQSTKDRIELIERQQEEFIVKLAEEYEEKLAALALAHREEESAGERAKVEIEQSRAVVDQLLSDCDKLTAENVRLKAERDGLSEVLEQARARASELAASCSGAVDDEDGERDGAGHSQSDDMARLVGERDDLAKRVDALTRMVERVREEAKQYAMARDEQREEIQRLELDLERARALAGKLQARDAGAGAPTAGDPGSEDRRGAKGVSAKRRAKLAVAKKSPAAAKKAKTSTTKRAKSEAPPKDARTSKPGKQKTDPPPEPPAAPTAPDGSSRRITAGSYSLIGGEFAEEKLDRPRKKR